MSFAAGWYADPRRPGGLRWWNGTEWTATVADAPPPVAVVPPPPTAWLDADDRSGFTAMDLVVHRARSLPTRALVWGIVGLVLPVALVPGVLAIMFGVGALARARRGTAAGTAVSGRRRAVVGIALAVAGYLLLAVLIVALLTIP